MRENDPRRLMFLSAWRYSAFKGLRGALALKISPHIAIKEIGTVHAGQSFARRWRRVLADLNALRSIGAYKTGVHKPTFSEPHMRSLEWLVQQLPRSRT